MDDLREELDRPQDVHAHHGLGEPRLAALERVDDLAVAEQRLLALGVVVPERGAERARDAGDRAQGGVEAGRLGGGDDDAVELLVERDLVLDGCVVRGAAGVGAVAQLVESRDALRADARRGAAGGIGLDERADVVEVGEVGGVELPDDGAPARLDVDEPLAGEEDERLADRRTRRLQALGKRLGAQPRARWERAGEDGLAELVARADGVRDRCLAVRHFAYPTRARSGKSRPGASRCMQFDGGSTLCDAVQLTICDVGPRDGLQNEATSLSPAVRAELCDRLAAAGVPRVEAVSFVHPKLVPQMAGAEEVMAAIERRPGTVYAGLVLNDRGYERALAAGVDEVHYAFPVTDEFCARNQNTTVAAAVETSAGIVGRAKDDGVRVTVTISVAFGCPFEGAVDPVRVLDIAGRVAATAPDEIVLADTIGVGVPSQVETLVTGAAALGVPVGCHFHNTRNTGFANAVAAVDAGCTVLDASVGGTGGCPFAPRATGNIATEDLVYLLHGMGHKTGIDLDALIEHAAWLSEQLGKELPGQLHKAGTFAPVAG